MDSQLRFHQLENPSTYNEAIGRRMVEVPVSERAASWEVNMGAKYEVWGRRKPRGKREPLAFGFPTEKAARIVCGEMCQKGFLDCVVVQRPPRYGWITGLQKTGLEN
jgi:hypothetical protein